MHRWERHGRADRVFNATIPDEPRYACSPRLVDLVRGSVSGICNLEFGVTRQDRLIVSRFITTGLLLQTGVLHASRDQWPSDVTGHTAVQYGD